MSSDDPKIKNIELLRLIILIVSLVLITGIIIIIVSNNCSGSSSRPGIFPGREPVVTTDEFNFDVGRSRTFANMNGSVAAAGSLGIQVLDPTGSETLRDSFRMTQPALISYATGCISFDIGGHAVRVFDTSKILSSFETEGIIVSASINNNGWFCVVTQRGGGIRGTVTVYNDTGARVFELDMRTGYALSAVLSHDNKNLAVLNLTETGSRITFYHDIDSEEDPYYFFDLPGGLIIDISYFPNNDVLVVSTDLLFVVTGHGESRALYPYHDKRLGAYTHTDDFIALHIYDYGLGYHGRIVTLSSDGTVLGESATDREVLSMSTVGRSLVVLKNDGVIFYNDELNEFHAYAGYLSAAGSSHVLAILEDTALATSDSSAIVFRREGER